MSAPAGLRRDVWTRPTMGTVASLHAIARGAPGPATRRAVLGAFAWLERVERTFSPFLADSEVSRIGRGDVPLAEASPVVRTVARECRAVEDASGGLFSAWWQGRFDPTGYVKGWAVDVAVQEWLAPLLGREGVEAVGLDVGGDMQLATAAGSAWAWRVGIVDPADPRRILARVRVRDGAVATSGSAERGRHIVDPRTGRPAAGVCQASVVAPRLRDADAWATVGVVAGFGDLTWAGRAPVRSGLLVSEAGEIRRFAARIAA